MESSARNRETRIPDCQSGSIKELDVKRLEEMIARANSSLSDHPESHISCECSQPKVQLRIAPEADA